MRKKAALSLLLTALLTSSLYSCGNETSVTTAPQVEVLDASAETLDYSQQTDDDIIIVGNAASGRFIANDGEYIYFQKSGRDGIYKKNLNSSENYKLSSEISCSDINLYGEWLYYVSNDDGICRIRKDGSERQILASGDDGGNNYIRYSNMTAYNGWIYYGYWISDMGRDYIPKPQSGLYKMRTDGSQKQKISDDSGRLMCIEDDWIYYSEVEDIHLGIGTTCRIRTDGSEKQVLTNYISYALELSDGYLFTDGSGGISRVLLDGSDSEGLLHDSNDLYISAVNVVDGWIYFGGYYYNYNSGWYNAIYKMRIDGSDLEKIKNTSSHIREVIVFGDTIFYHTDENFNALHKIRIDGTDHEVIM